MEDSHETGTGLARTSAADTQDWVGAEAASGPQEDEGTQSPFYTTAELAVLYGVHDWTIRDWVGKGKLPAPIPLYKRWKFSRAVIDAHLREMGIEPAA